METLGAGLTARWTRCRRPSAAAAVNLVLLPHAGGSAGFYRAWHELLPREVELHVVQYPGREDRFAEPLVDDMAVLADALAEALAPLFSRPVVLFGHSMGASIALEVLRRLEAAGHRPRLLIASGRGAPHRLGPGTLHAAPDDELVEEVRRQSGSGSAALDDPDLRALLLPMIRSDYRLSEAHRPVGAAPVATPVAVLRGRTDTAVTEELATAWGELTTGGSSQFAFDGGHFYFQGQESRVVATVVDLVHRAVR
ncbi:alpha/beta fold hydrolase [Kitasatospora sp. NPDC049285]|uniref:thioesterase II family protein n=1 Tax=Kitasatospora sp. NPDC049285 TaxID=3157096 RepID=UPI0034141FA9